MYYLIMALFLIDGRDSDGEVVRVLDAEMVKLKAGDLSYEGVTTQLTEHNLMVFLDESESLNIGTQVCCRVGSGERTVEVNGVVTGISDSKSGSVKKHTIEILDFAGQEMEWLQLLYDRVPTLPQSLHRDFGVVSHLWQNVAHRVARTRK